MLTELSVSNLGVIAELSLVLRPGMTAVTGETGAGKTLVVGAIDLLLGGRADSGLVRTGTDEAVVSGRFVLGDDGTDEVILRRVIPRAGRSRAYVNGHPATAAELADHGRRLVDLHGQHAHQSLLRTSVQRGALDRFGGIDLEPLRTARKELRAVEDALEALGGDERSRSREIDLLRFQLTEIDDVGLDDPDEDAHLEALQDSLAGASQNREAAARAVAALADDGGILFLLADVHASLGDEPTFAPLATRLAGLDAELGDVTSELRRLADHLEDDPERLAEVTDRRKVLHDLRRKYGDELVDVLRFRDEVAERLAALEDHDRAALALDGERQVLARRVADAEAAVGVARRAAAPKLAKAVVEHLKVLGLEKASFSVQVGDRSGDDVAFLFSANPGAEPAPLTKVASGGELARTMLALRLVLSDGPSTLVFDEVDAGIGGTAAIAVGRALAELGTDHQVLVVTHLAQVAATADNQAVVAKDVHGRSTSTSVVDVEGDDRVVELARMLSGTPDSVAAQEHATELLARSRRRS